MVFVGTGGKLLDHCPWAKFVALTFLALLYFVPNATAETEKVVLQLRWTHQFQFAGYYAALEQGFYREVGLEVEIRPRADAPNAVEEVLAGHAEYGVTNSRLLLERLRGRPLVALAAIMQHSPLVWVSQSDKQIHHIQDLVERRVKMTEGGGEIELVAALRHEGISVDDVHAVDGYASYEDYFDPELDAVAAYLTNQPYYYLEKNTNYAVIRPSTYGIDFYGDALFTSEQEVADHPERVKAFRQASLRGWEYAMQHPQEVVSLILERYQSAKSREHLLYEAEQMRQLLLPEVIEVGHMNPGRWQYMAETFVAFGLADNTAALEGFLFDPNPAIDTEYYRRLLLLAVAAVLSVSLIAVALYAFNRRLRREMQLRMVTEQEKAELIDELSLALQEVKRLSGLLPICSYCKKIRDDAGEWMQIDQYVEEHSDASFSHGMCEGCMAEHHPAAYLRIQEKRQKAK